MICRIEVRLPVCQCYGCIADRFLSTNVFFFCSNTQRTCLSQVSVSKIYWPVLVGRVNTFGEVRYSLSVPTALSSSYVGRPNSFAYDLQSRLESGHVIFASPATSRVHTLHSPRNDLRSVMVVGTCSLPVAYVVWYATSGSRGLVTWPI